MEQQTQTIETPKKKAYVATPKNLAYQRNYRRKMRLKNRKCSCGEQGFAKVLLTQEIKCAKHMVAPLKEELQREAQLEKKAAP